MMRLLDYMKRTFLLNNDEEVHSKYCSIMKNYIEMNTIIQILYYVVVILCFVINFNIVSTVAMVLLVIGLSYLRAKLDIIINLKI